MKNLIGNILLAAASCILCFFVIELGFKMTELVLWTSRLFMKPQLCGSSIEGLPYDNNPNAWFLKYGPIGGWTEYKHNSLGMRDNNRVFDKPASVKRIVCLGDSIIHGEETPFNNTFSQQLERKLNLDNTGNVEVLNCGVSSYTLSDYYIYLKNKGIKFHPDLLIIGLCLNDYLLPCQRLEKIDNAAVFKEPTGIAYKRRLKRFIFHSYIVGYFQKAVNNFKRIKDRAVPAEYNEMLSQKSWRRNISIISGIKKICDDNRCNLLIVIFPVAEQFNIMKNDPYPQNTIRGILEQLDIRYIDLRPDFGEYIYSTKNLYCRRDSLHFYPKGYDIAVGRVYGEIKKSCLLNKR